MRARVKALKDMPEHSKCCEATITAMLPYLEKEIEIEAKTHFMVEVCIRCGAEYNGEAFADKNNKGHSYYSDYLDIDEGEDA